MLEFLVVCLILAVVVYVVILLINMFGLPHPIDLIAKLIVAVLALLFLLSRFAPELMTELK